MKHVWQKNLSTGENIRKRVEDRRNQIISTPGVRVDRTSHGVRIRLPKTRASTSGSGANTTAWAIDVSAATEANGYTCDITPGYVFYSGAFWPCGGDTVQVLGGSISSPHYVYLNIDISTGGALTGTIASVASASLPVSDVNTIRWLLHTVYRSGTSVIHLCQHQCSSISLQTFMR